MKIESASVRLNNTLRKHPAQLFWIRYFSLLRNFSISVSFEATTRLSSTYNYYTLLVFIIDYAIEQIPDSHVIQNQLTHL